MFQYLPHRRRLCDETNQVHPPAASAALERKHPEDARQQLRPHIARPLFRPRGAGNFAHHLWPGRLAPRHQLPAGLRRHPRPPRRGRCQYPKVALLMLARRRYQRRYPTRKSMSISPSSMHLCRPSLTRARRGRYRSTGVAASPPRGSVPTPRSARSCAATRTPACTEKSPRCPTPAFPHTASEFIRRCDLRPLDRIQVPTNEVDNCITAIKTHARCAMRFNHPAPSPGRCGLCGY